MIEIGAANLFAAMPNVALMSAKIRNGLDHAPMDAVIEMSDNSMFPIAHASLVFIGQHAEELGMPVTESAVWRCVRLMDAIQTQGSRIRVRRTDLENLAEQLSSLTQIFSDEIGTKNVFVIDSKHAAFFKSETASFGQNVEDAFPSSVPEIAEAGKCRALGRWTACVMHLMRALDPALLALQAKVEVDTPKEQWDQVINQIESKIREIRKHSHGRDDEQWYSEAASNFRIIKNAWRNQAQHLHERYDEERTVEIYDSVRAFMRHLATRLSE